MGRSFLMSILGSIIPGISAGASAFSAYSGYKANEANLKFAKQTRDMLINQANTTFQRGRKDMLAAGLNPMLMAKGGGDPTPALPSSAGQSSLPDAGQGITAAYSAYNAKQLQTAQAQQAQANARVAQGLPAVQQAQINQLNSGAAAALMQGQASSAQAAAAQINAASQAGLSRAQIAHIALTNDLTNAQVAGQIKQNIINTPAAAKANAFMGSYVNPNSVLGRSANYLPSLGHVGEAAGIAASAYSAYKLLRPALPYVKSGIGFLARMPK